MKSLKATNPIYAQEAERVLNNIPDAIKSGYKNGVAVNTPFSLPIVFKLEKPDPLKDFTKDN